MAVTVLQVRIMPADTAKTSRAMMKLDLRRAAEACISNPRERNPRL